MSYNHNDAAKVEAILREIVTWGYPIWYDRYIPGGSEWDEEIEQRIERCRLLVVFLSNAAIDSKYVRREVKFADTLKKPLIGVCLEPVNLAHGMRMLMQQYQMLDADTQQFQTHFRNALQHQLQRFI